MYDSSEGKPFVVENVNYYGDCRFAPDAHFIGAPTKNCPVIEEYVEYIARMISNDYTAESIFLNDLSKWCALRCGNGKMHLVNASDVGVKNLNHKAIVTEMFFEQAPLNIYPNTYGILIPHDQIIKRTALNWLAYLSKDELMTWDTELGMYLNKIERVCSIC